MATDPKKEFRYDYTKFRPKGISVERLDQLADFVFNGNAPSNLGAIIAAIKLAVAIAYITARRIMISDEMEIAKQQYEVSQGAQIGDDLNRDDLDTRK